MPDHLVSLLKEEMITHVVGLCDGILYKVSVVSKLLNLVLLVAWIEGLGVYVAFYSLGHIATRYKPVTGWKFLSLYE